MTRRHFLAQAITVAAAGWAAFTAPTLWASASPTATLDERFSNVLGRHVRWNRAGTNTAVDYAGVRRERAALQAVLDGFSRVSLDTFEGWPRNVREAFLVNAYNAWTLALIADAPAGTESIKDLGTFLQSPWKKSFIPFLGDTRSLDDIEHGLLRGAAGFAEPRIHFAVNCASIGCPALRPEAFTAERWVAQLDDQTQRFLRDRTRNRIAGRSPLKLEVSSIFDWYGSDFDAGGGVRGFLAGYPDALGLRAADLAALRDGQADLAYLDYDWRLNAANAL